jgi:Arf/Sar family protein
MGAVLEKLYSVLFSKNVDIVVLGLENAGKSTLLSCLFNGRPTETTPTIGLNVKILQKSGVNIKAWDIGGAQQFRSEWGRYTKGCDVLVYVVDVNDRESVPTAKIEVHRLLEDASLGTTPILVCANKIDLPHMEEEELIRELNLDYITSNPWIVIPISALENQDVHKVLTWLISHAR